MFDISFGELLIIGAVALIVLGPERLPTVARTIGALLGRAQRFVASVKTDIQQQSQMVGLGELKQEMQQAADAFRQQVEGEVADARQAVQALQYQIEDAGTVEHAPPPAADPAAVDGSQLDLFAAPASPPPTATDSRQ